MSDEPNNSPNGKSSPQPNPNHTYNIENLYSGSGPGERPRARDIQQTSIGNCGFLSAMGSIAEQQPDRIKDSITFDPKSGNFGVTVYRDNGQAVQVLVSQSDIANNLARSGGSSLDDNQGRTTPVWPAVIETAVAKSRDTNHADGLDQGYQALTMWPSDAMRAISGQSATNISAAQASTLGEDKLHDRISQALASDRPVTLTTNSVETVANAQDGLVDNHVYMVERAYKDKDGNLMLDLRNPWAQNNDSELPNSSSPVVSVRYDHLVNNGGLNQMTIGPAPVSKQASLDVHNSDTQLASAATMTQAPIDVGDASLNRLIASVNSGNIPTGLRNFANEPDLQSLRQQNQAEVQQVKELERSTAMVKESQDNPVQHQETTRARAM